MQAPLSGSIDVMVGGSMMVHNKDRTNKMLAKYLQRSDAAFLDETYNFVRNYTERTP